MLQICHTQPRFSFYVELFNPGWRKRQICYLCKSVDVKIHHNKSKIQNPTSVSKVHKHSNKNILQVSGFRVEQNHM